jgi:hypothetical protein
MGLYYAATGVSQLVASGMMGWVWDSNGATLPFLISGLLALAATIAILFTQPSKR